MKWLKRQTVLLTAMMLWWTPLSQADTQFRVIVDASGSMVISDPDKLTAEALRLISDLAPEEKTTLGIWLFGEAPRVLLPEAPINKANKAKLANYVKSYVTQDVKTDLEAILALLLKTPDAGNLAPGFSRHWILVTDGMVDISLDEAVNKASRERILNGLTQQLEANDIHLHTISMTGYTDKALLQTLSLKTNATHTEVAIPEDLLDTFERIFSQADPEQKLPFAGNKFVVDPSVNEITLMVFHEPKDEPQVVTPDGAILPLISQGNVSIAASDHYTLVTVKKPQVGDWLVNNVDLKRSSVRIITDLNAKVTAIPPIVFVNEKIASNVGLYQKNEQIKDKKILDLVSVKQTLMRINGENKEVVWTHNMQPSSNQFKANMEPITEPGNYELLSDLDGKTFSRQLEQYFSVYPAIEFNGTAPGENLVSFSAKPSNLRLNVTRSSVTLAFTYQDGTQHKENMPLIGQGYWEKLTPVAADDAIKVRAHLQGFTQAGESFDYWTPQWSVLREGEATPLVQLGSQVAARTRLSDNLNDTIETDHSVAPLSVPPAVVVVTDDSQTTANEQPKVAKQEPIAEHSTFDDTLEEVEGISKDEWILYGLLNLGGILILVTGVVLYRRFKRRATQTYNDDLNDV